MYLTANLKSTVFLNDLDSEGEAMSTKKPPDAIAELTSEVDIRTDEAVKGRERIVELEKALAKSEEMFNEQVECYEQKLKALAPHGTCACSYDHPNDKCMHHSPKIAELEAEFAKKRETVAIEAQSAIEELRQSYDLEIASLKAQLVTSQQAVMDASTMYNDLSETARELLEALVALNALMRSHANRPMTNSDQHRIDKAFNLADAAIAHAKAGEKGTSE
jgi:hypothetical protein